MKLRRSFQWRGRQSLNLELKLLFLRVSPFKERCSMVDAASNPARTLLRSSTRAHAEVGMLIVVVSCYERNGRLHMPASAQRW